MNVKARLRILGILDPVGGMEADQLACGLRSKRFAAAILACIKGRAFQSERYLVNLRRRRGSVLSVRNPASL
jgi:hypothetical protein